MIARRCSTCCPVKCRYRTSFIHMLHEGDVDDRLRHLDIGLRRRRIARGMIADQDYRAVLLRNERGLGPLPCESRRIIATASGNALGKIRRQVWCGSRQRDYRRSQTNEFDQDRRMIPYARFPIGTTFPPLRGTRDTTAALARSSKAVAMYFA